MLSYLIRVLSYSIGTILTNNNVFIYIFSKNLVCLSHMYIYLKSTVCTHCIWNKIRIWQVNHFRIRNTTGELVQFLMMRKLVYNQGV
jgi:hypothetical protein